jgi:hypothetical protein
MVEITYQMVLSTLQTLALIVGIAYYLFIMRNSQRNQQIQLETRKTEIYMQLIRQTRTPEFMKQWSTVMDMEFTGRQEWNEKYGPSANPEAFSAYMTVLQTYNSIAQLVKNDILDVETLYDLIMPVAFLYAWEKAKPQITEWSEDEGYHPWETLEWLVGELDKYLDVKKDEFRAKKAK